MSELRSQLRKPSSGKGGRYLYRSFGSDELREGVKRGDYQTWALCGLDHPVDSHGQPLQRQVRRGPDHIINQPFLRILHAPPKKYGSAPWKWVHVDVERFIELVGLHGLVMRKRIKGKVVRLMYAPDPRKA